MERQFVPRSAWVERAKSPSDNLTMKGRLSKLDEKGRRHRSDRCKSRADHDGCEKSDAKVYAEESTQHEIGGRQALTAKKE